MTLEVVGAGFGRTGTLSLKGALETLGYVRCHHMLEVFGHPEQLKYWIAAVKGEPVDWDALFEGYRAAVDWPSAHFWRELAEYYPESKVLLSVRDPASWYESVKNTIYQAMSAGAVPVEGAPEEAQEFRAAVREIVIQRTFGGNFDDRERALRMFDEHIETVKATIPAERLLVYNVAEGWEPLCAFLGCPVPDAPFPRTNTTNEFRDRLGLDPVGS